MLPLGFMRERPPVQDGLVAWYPADGVNVIDTVTGLKAVAGGSVGYWNNELGPAYVANGSPKQFRLLDAAHLPVFTANVQNGRPGIYFPAGGTFTQLECNDNVIGSPTAVEVFLVAKGTAAPGTEQAPWSGALYAGSDYQRYPYSGDDHVYDATCSNTLHDLGAGSGALVRAAHILNIVSSAAEWTARINNIQVFTTATNAVAVTVNPFLGAFSGLFEWKGYIFELLFFIRVLSTGERAATHAFLKAKYATP